MLQLCSIDIAMLNRLDIWLPHKTSLEVFFHPIKLQNLCTDWKSIVTR